MKSTNSLIAYLDFKKINYKLVKESQKQLIISFEILAKPGCKVQKISVSNEGIFSIFVNQRAIDSEANESIIRYFAKNLGISPSCINLTSGLKSKRKKISVSYSFTDHKDVDYYLEKLQLIFI